MLVKVIKYLPTYQKERHLNMKKTFKKAYCACIPNFIHLQKKLLTKRERMREREKSLSMDEFNRAKNIQKPMLHNPIFFPVFYATENL